MKTVPVTLLKSQLAQQLRAVKEGEEVVVTEHGQPIARIIPVRGVPLRLKEIVDAGLAVVGGGLTPQFWELPPGADPTGSVGAALNEDREDRA